MAKDIQNTSFFSLFRFSTKSDKLLIFLGSICACIMGALINIFSIFWGEINEAFADNSTVVENAKATMLKFVYISVGLVISGWGMYGCWMVAG